ncbi:MAG: hypothetical protein HDS39_07140, partial [Bacteroides sp.]|nr:hypothetical protein [Bacteroides sp.]
TECRGFEPFLSDAAVSGHLCSASKKNTIPLDGQYINVFDFNAERGAVNIITTGKDGYFEVSPEIGTSLGQELLLKPLVDDDLKPMIDFDKPFKGIADIRKQAVERNYPIIRKNTIQETEDTVDYSGRHTIRLEEIVVKGKGNVFAKRNKVIGYLDSIALSMHTAWVCCGGWVKGEYVGGWLNDYVNGYTHHPENVPYYNPPQNVTTPVRGKIYNMVKYKWSEKLGTCIVVDERRIHYTGPRFSDEELLRMEGMWNVKGYYPKHRLKLPFEEDLIDGIEDFRNTLLWLPRAQTDDNGEFSVEFPTSDIKSTFKLTCIILNNNIRSMNTLAQYFKVK